MPRDQQQQRALLETMHKPIMVSIRIITTRALTCKPPHKSIGPISCFDVPQGAPRPRCQDGL
jgi:hypothetical protein